MDAHARMISFLNNTACGDLLYFLTKGKSRTLASTKTGGPTVDQYLVIDTESGEAVVERLGEDDPENPYNWSFGYKAYVSILLFIMTMSVYMGSSIVSPGIPDLAQQFGVSETVAILAMSLFVWAYGIGPCFLSPNQRRVEQQFWRVELECYERRQAIQTLVRKEKSMIRRSQC